MPFKLYADGAMIKQGLLDESGALPILHSPAVQSYKLEMANGVTYELRKTDKGYARVFEPANTEYEDIEIERCFEYVTLLNVRNWV